MTTATNVFTAAKVKTFNGREGSAYRAELLRNGVKVADVLDDASGAPLSFFWLDQKAKRVTGPVRSYDDSVVTMNMTPEEAVYAAHVFAVPPYKNPFAEGTMPTTMEGYADDLVNEAVTAKRIKTKMTKRVLYIKDGGLYAVGPYNRDVDLNLAIATVKSKYSNTITILNELPLAEAAKLVCAISN